MDESTLGSIRCRVPILDGEFYSAWKNEMLEIFYGYNLNKYITSPCVPPNYPLHPTPDEYLDMTRNLRAIDLIIRGLLEICLYACLHLNVPLLYGDTLRSAFQTVP